MINPTELDIGRAVVYRNQHEADEEGVVTAWNEGYVFVDYGSGASKATRRADLDWAPLSHVAVAIALALYGYNVSPINRARKLYEHFDGDCASLEDLVAIMDSNRVAFAATELAFPTAEVYVGHAIEKYGEEAQRREHANRSAHVR